MVCYVLGANPSQNAMTGFVHRIWGKFGIDKVSLVGRGVFLVRFKTMENFQKVMQESTQFLNSKPVMVKPWTTDQNFAKDPIKLLPTWIKLTGLDVKFWGE